MKKNKILAALALSTVVSHVSAQTLSIDDLRAQIDTRVEEMNPYAELLNDPDPARSMAAMEIMLEQGDETLKRMALEFGLLSPNPQVRRAAFEAYLATKPNLTVQVDGSSVEEGEQSFRNAINYLGGTISANRKAFFLVRPGKYNAENDCFVLKNGDRCTLTSNGDGVFLSYKDAFSDYSNGRGVLTEEGTISGTLSLTGVKSALPFVVQIMR